MRMGKRFEGVENYPYAFFSTSVRRMKERRNDEGSNGERELRLDLLADGPCFFVSGMGGFPGKAHPGPGGMARRVPERHD
jgi:hypothetical protein